MPDPGASHAYTRLGRFALIVTTLLWGSSFTIMKDALATVPARGLLAIRFSGAAMLMALIGIRSLRRLDRGYLTGGACMGVCLYLAYTLQTYGLVHTTPGKNAFLAATYCVFVPFFWWLIHKRRPDRYNLAAALLCLCGMGLVSRQSDLRIGVMGCIVNGPGEMADADYGYVGAAPGRITLYKGRTVVERNIPQEEALDRLIALIRENGDWQEPE